MDWITTSGKTLHEAKSNALDQLGIVADEAEFDVVNDVEKSLFGRVKTEARVRARVRPRPIPEKEDRGRRRSGNKSNGGNRRGANKSTNKQNGGGANSSKNQRSNKAGQKASSGKQSGQQQSNNAKASNGKGQSSKKSSSGGNQDNTKKAAAAASAAPKKEKKAVETEISREDQEKIATGFLEGLLTTFDMTGSVSVVQEPADDGAIEMSVTGEELGLLVGQKGVTLNSLQELTRTVVQRNAEGAKTDRLRVDVAGYRARRTAALQDFATKIANDVIETGTEKLLEPMGPADRKVVHDTVNDIDGVETGSEGEEPRRRVVIRPAS